MSLKFNSLCNHQGLGKCATHTKWRVNTHSHFWKWAGLWFLHLFSDVDWKGKASKYLGGVKTDLEEFRVEITSDDLDGDTQDTALGRGAI